MKHTIKLAPFLAMVVNPSIDGFSVSFAVVRGGVTDFQVNLTPDEAGVLIFALEQAVKAGAAAAERHARLSEEFAARLQAASGMAGGVRCHGDGCAAGQLPCPSTKACLV